MTPLKSLCNRCNDRYLVILGFNVLLIGWKQKIAVLLLFINNVLLFKKGMYELIIYNEFNKMHLYNEIGKIVV